MVAIFDTFVSSCARASLGFFPVEVALGSDWVATVERKIAARVAAICFRTLAHACMMFKSSYEMVSRLVRLATGVK